MQTLFGLFALDNAEAAVAELERRAGADGVNLIAAETIKDRLTNGRPPVGSPSVGRLAPVEAPSVAHLLSRKRPIFLGEAGSVYAIHDVAAHIIQMAQSPSPTKTPGSLKVALEEYGVATHFAEAYATGVTHGYVLLFVNLPENQLLETSERLEQLGGRQVFAFQRLD
jgi:hypothetical protein